MTVTVGGDVAFCHSLNHLGNALWFRSTIGLCKIDSQWRVTHEHNSTPFYMDGSDKAALDRALKPGARHAITRPKQTVAPVGFQNSATGPDLGFYAARSYSLMRPPRTGRRLIRSWERSATG